MSIIKLPGLVDVHVHLREPGATHKENFATGTCAAVAGGYTQILDMPNNPQPTITPAAFAQKINLAKDRIWCDVGLNFGGTTDSIRYFKKVAPKVFGLKVYMNATTGPLLMEKAADRELIFERWTSPLPIMVHAEGETVEAAIKFAKKYQKALHVCHVTTDQINSIEKARKEGISITCEVTPHHLFLNQRDVKRLGSLALMKPPLMSAADQQKIWDHLDKIDMIATDHAPHTLKEKQGKAPPFGVPGLETTLPLMLSAIDRGLLSIKRLIELTHTNPRRIFKLPVQPQTYVLVNFAKTFKISSRHLFTKCAWTPFEGMDGRGQIKKVVLRDRTIFANGKFISSPQGQIIYSQLSTL